MKRCYSCFKEFDDLLSICPYCGKVHQTEPEEPIFLIPGTVLAERYIIGECVGSGGFGVVYRAWDAKLETILAIKEFYPRRLVARAQGTTYLIIAKKYQEEFDYRKKRFLSEARSMAKLGKHRSIPNVFEFFEANHSAYIVMELLEGLPLNVYLDQVEGKLDPDFAVMIATEVGNALKSLHANGIIHRDVAPDNIYICSGKEIQVKLMDLGAARLADDTDDVIDIILKPGFSPNEQYDNTGNIGAWTDIYALGATLYRMITGIKPEEATNRKIEDNVVAPKDIDESISENLSNTIMKAMAVDRHMRFQNIDTFLEALSGERKVVSLEEERKKRKTKRLVGIAAACFAVFIAGAVVFSQYSAKKAETTLKTADLTMWISVTEDSTEEEATKAVIEDFTEKFPDVKIDLKSIPEEEYPEAIRNAATMGTLPSIFESTGISDEVLESAADVNEIIESEQAVDCFFLDQYEEYYGGKYKQVPIGIEVPMAFVITNGYISTDYNSNYFNSADGFDLTKEDEKPEPVLSLDGLRRAIVEENFPSVSFDEDDYGNRRNFLSEGDNTSPVMLSSSMTIEEIRENLLGYEKAYVFYNGNDIKGNFTYEWSMTEGSKNENAAATRLLQWMLGNVYQNTLMISISNEGQIPINKTCYEYKLENQILEPLSSLTDKIKLDGAIREKNSNPNYIEYAFEEKALDKEYREAKAKAEAEVDSEESGD